jgi:D-alanyl-D-alanine carboxypeptidase
MRPLPSAYDRRVTGTVPPDRRHARALGRPAWAVGVGLLVVLAVAGGAGAAAHRWGPGGGGARASTPALPAASASGGGPSETPSGTPSASPSATPTAAATPTPSATPTDPGIDLTAHSTTDPDSIWVIVNKQHPLVPEDYAPSDLVEVDGARIRAVAADDLRAMLAAAKADGVTMGVRTAFRSYDQQAAIRADVEARRGYAHAETYSARPGYSEHETGLALDLHGTSKPSCDLKVCFDTTAEAQWVAAHGVEYGFVVRYTPANTAVTGFSAESWHLRYVGRELAVWLRDHGVGSLEEAFGVTGGPDYPAAP